MNDFSEDDAFEAAAIPLSQRAMVGRAAPYLDGLNPVSYTHLTLPTTPYV